MGDPIDVEWRGKYYPATILSAQGSGQYMIHYDGYGDEWNEVVGEDRIRERGAEEP